MVLDELQVAKVLCLSAHKGQVDKNGVDFYTHPFRVSDSCETENEKILAYIHDIVETPECGLNLNHFIYMGFSEEIIQALDAITRKQGESYSDYIVRVSKNKLATKVKIKDIMDNLRKDRWCWGARDNSNWHWERYTDAYRRLTGEDYNE